MAAEPEPGLAYPERFVRIKRQVAHLKQAFRPDVVHVHLSDPSVLFHLQTSRVASAPLLLSLHVGLPEHGGGSDTILGAALRAADWVTANSEALLGDAQGLEPGIVGRSSVLPISRKAPEEPWEPLPAKAPRLVGVGRLVADKGFDRALEAFALIAARYPAARLILAGEGPARPALEQQAVALGIDQRVDFLGWVAPERVPLLMKSAYLAIVPSRWREAFGMVALEAALMGRPVVATRVGGLPEVVLHGETGLLVENGDIPGLAEAIAFLLDCPQAGSRMGQAARERALASFAWEPYVDAHEQLYKRLAEKSLRASEYR